MSTQAELDEVEAAIAAIRKGGGVTMIREVDGRQVTLDLPFLLKERARLQRKLAAESGSLTGGMFQRISYRGSGNG